MDRIRYEQIGWIGLGIEQIGWIGLGIELYRK